MNKVSHFHVEGRYFSLGIPASFNNKLWPQWYSFIKIDFLDELLISPFLVNIQYMRAEQLLIGHWKNNDFLSIGIKTWYRKAENIKGLQYQKLLINNIESSFYRIIVWYIFQINQPSVSVYQFMKVSAVYIRLIFVLYLKGK